MKVQDLTASQLKRAAALKQRIEELSQELDALLGAPVKTGRVSRKGWKMSAATKRKIAAAQKARWAKLRRAKAAAS